MDSEQRIQRLEIELKALQQQLHAPRHRAGGADEVIQIRNIRAGLAANKPTKGRRGDIYFETDTPALFVYTGSAWEHIGTNADTIDEYTTDAGVTVEGTKFEDGTITLKTPSELTISSGAITKTQSRHTIDTESDDATDDLATINGGSEGDLLIIRPVHPNRTVVVKHGTGNLYISGGGDFTMDEGTDYLVLLYDAGGWFEISRSENHA